MTSDQLPGFDSRVRQQLSDLSKSQQDRRPSISSLSSASQSSYHTTYSSQIHPRNSHQPRPSRGTSYSRPHSQSGFYTPPQPQPPPTWDSFPPLGFQQTGPPPNMPPQQYAAPASYRQPPYANNSSSQQSQSAAHEFFTRTRGRGRGRGARRGDSPHQQFDANTHTRPSNYSQQPQNSNNNRNFANHDQQRAYKQRQIEQSDYVNTLVASGFIKMLRTEEIDQKEAFAKKLEAFARDVVQRHADASDSRPYRVKLQPYGSLANSFGTAGCDADLLLTIGSPPEPYLTVTDDVKRDLEKVLLDNGIGAHLLTNTRIPILRVCEKPPKELLRNLRDQRSRWELAAEELTSSTPSDHTAPQPPTLSSVQQTRLEDAFQNMAVDAADVPLPDSPPLGHAKLEFIGDCGIQCDINFGFHMALVNSKLLWTYGQCDPRVRQVGIFVKTWAKTRDINTPYRGTLSSYGYILMVLHYLMNVAYPAVIPNLQEMAKNDGWDPIPSETFEGHDIRFTQNLSEIRQRMTIMTKNSSTVGGLLIGFFRYYGQGYNGFRWVEQVISLRTHGGIISKQDKGWTKARWAEENPNVKQRYLLAIEDPFEIDHNVARTVGHHGILAIRDEFRRAWERIDKVQSVRTLEGHMWTWSKADGTPGGDAMDLISPSESRGDLLRMDTDSRKQKAEVARQLRQELELKEETERQLSLVANDSLQDGRDKTGTWREKAPSVQDHSNEVVEVALLIQNFQHQDQKVSRMRSLKQERARIHDEDDDAEYNEVNVPHNDNLVTESNAQPHDNDAVWRDEERERTRVQDPWTPELQPENRQLPESRYDDDHAGGGAGDWQLDMPVQNSSYGPDMVGEHIEWTSNSVAGVWLRKRDNLVRSGQWKAPTADDPGRLHAAFPYDPTMTKDRLHHLNAKLETYYKDTLYPKSPAEHHLHNPQPAKILLEAEDTHILSNNQPWGDVEEPAPDEKTPEGWPVGEDIPWSGSTEAGTYLLWRDGKFRRGRRFASAQWNGVGAKLSDLFPFNPKETMANINYMNEELDTCFAGLIYPRKEMPKSQQYAYAEDMHNAIAKVEAGRTAASFRKQVRFDEIYMSDGSRRTQEPVSIGAEPSTFRHQDTVLENAIWTDSNRAGSWLRHRDDLIDRGEWKDSKRDDSIFAYLHRLYPYERHVDPCRRERQNRELITFFEGVELPVTPWEDGEAVTKAILKLTEHRKDDAEANRIRSLINLFKQQRLEGLNSHQKNSSRAVKRESGPDQEKSMLALKAIADQVSVPAIKPVENQQQSLGEQVVSIVQPTNSLDELRRYRLSYYQKQESEKAAARDAEAKPLDLGSIKRRDSGAVGSCNDLQPIPNDMSHHVEVAEHKQTAEHLSWPDLPTTSNNGLTSNVQTTPDRTEEGSQFPRKMAAETCEASVASSEFEFDTRQLADIANIRAGGNGCVRGEFGPFSLESDRFSWGAAGAMGHRSPSRKEDKAEHSVQRPYDEESVKNLATEMPGHNEW